MSNLLCPPSQQVRINPSGYSSSLAKHEPPNPSAYSQFLNLAQSPLTTSHLSRSTSASNTAALAAAVAAALTSKQSQHQQHQQHQHHQHHQQHLHHQLQQHSNQLSFSAAGLLSSASKQYQELSLSSQKYDTQSTHSDEMGHDQDHGQDRDHRDR